ncbi:helix-turn-helix domain-containing protein [Photobacterium phosphoreum]|uniref:helix-turn-helix domain-containing protein n=1 Tax=Photobacterium phosphoreum TaxID=659 RepID=UPI0015E685B0|nr:helix-turn-helix domain-containing protein [Photobacterium phosphoreum]
MNIDNKIGPFDYNGGTVVLDRINQVLSLKGRAGISDRYEIRPGTISTWKKREQTPFELAVRINISEGVSLKWLLLGEGEMYENITNETKTDSFDQFNLENGNLSSIESLELDHKNITQHFNISNSDTIAIRTEKKTYLVDKSANTITSGEYLVKMDNTHIISNLTRLPNSKVLIDLYGREIEIVDSDIDIEGKVVAGINKY